MQHTFLIQNFVLLFDNFLYLYNIIYMEKRLRNKIIFINTMFLILTVFTDVLYITLKNAYIFKTLASLVFVACGFANIIIMVMEKHLKHQKYFVFLFIGLIFAMAGDILLVDHFVIGAALFAVGHVFYFISYLTLQKFKLVDLAFIIPTLAIALVVIFTTGLEFGGMLPLILAYAVVICTMLGKSASLFLTDKKNATMIFVGSLMFFLSDMFLMLCMFSSMGKIADILCLAFYYPAQFVLASAPALVGRKK